LLFATTEKELFQVRTKKNAAHPSGLRAERVAIFHSGAIYPDAEILKLAVTAGSDTNPTTSPIPPCGACRQSISEVLAQVQQDTPIEIFFMGEMGEGVSIRLY